MQPPEEKKTEQKEERKKKKKRRNSQKENSKTRWNCSKQQPVLHRQAVVMG